MQKKSVVTNSNTFVVGTHGKFIPNKTFTNDTGLLDIIDPRGLDNGKTRATKLVFNDTGDAFASCDSSGNVYVFYILKNRYVNVCRDIYPTSICFTEKYNGLVFVALPTKVIEVYNLGGKLLHKLKGHKFNITTLTVNHARALLLSCSHDACILWDLNSFKIQKTFHSKASGFTTAAFSPDADSLITAFQDSSIYFWSLSSFEIEEKIALPDESKVNRIGSSFESKYMAVAGSSPIVYVFSMSNKQEYRSYQIPGGCDQVRDLFFLRGSRLAILGNDDIAYIVDIEKQDRIALKKGLPGQAIISLALDVTGKFMAAATVTGEIYLYDLEKLIHDEEKTINKRLALGVPPELVYNTLKPSAISQIYKEADQTSSDICPKDQAKGSGTMKGGDTILKGAENRVRGSETLERQESPRLKQSSRSSVKHSSRDPYEEHKHAESFHQQSIHQRSTQKENHNSLNQSSRLNASAHNASVHNASAHDASHISNPADRTRTLEPLFRTANIDLSKTNLSQPKLAKLLAKYGLFPDKHRGLIWRFLLSLPFNQEAFDNLVARGVHPAFENLHKTYPISSNKLFQKLQRILSCLAHYSPVFSEVEYLPSFVFPFVKLFANDELLCFEILLTFFLQWGQHFFEYFPNLPITLIHAVEELIKYHDNELFKHLKSLNLNMVSYIWPVIQNCFTDILSREDWLSLLDFLVLHNDNPLFFVHFVTAYLVYFRSTLLNVTDGDFVELFVKKQNAVNIKSIIKAMVKLNETTPNSSVIINYTNNLPIINAQYPFFTYYPKYSVDQARKVREDMLDEERKLEQRREQIQQMNTLTEQLLKQEELFREKQEALVRAEKDRKEMMLYEDEMRLQQKLKIETDSRERRLAQMKALEQAVKNSLVQQEALRREEIKLMDQEFEVRSRIDAYRCQSKLEEEALLNVEFQAQQRLNEAIDLRNREERSRRLRIEMDNRDRQLRMKDKVWEDNMEAQDQEFKLRMELIRQQKLNEFKMQQEENEKKEVEYRLMLEDFDRELKIKDVERERKLRLIAEEEVIKNEEFMRLYKMQEDAVKEEEKRQLRAFMDEEKKAAIARAEERLAILEQEKRQQANELEGYRERLNEISNAQKRAEFEDMITNLRREHEGKMLQEEKALQKMILEIEQERKVQREMQQELAQQERFFQQNQQFQRELERNEERIINEERAKFQEFRSALSRELEKVEELKERMLEDRLNEAAQGNQQVLRERMKELAQSIQQKYIQQLQEADTLESEKEEEEGPRHRIESQRPSANVRTGNFRSELSTAQKLGQSASSYTYSDNGGDEGKSRKNKSLSHNPLSETQSRHQTRSMSDVGKNVASQQFSQGQFNPADERLRTSQDEQAGKYRNIQSSPDNLTYSSLEASNKKDDKQ